MAEDVPENHSILERCLQITGECGSNRSARYKDIDALTSRSWKDDTHIRWDMN